MGYIYRHTIMTSVKVKTIPARIVTDRKHIFSAMLQDINDMGPTDFIEMSRKRVKSTKLCLWLSRRRQLRLRCLSYLRKLGGCFILRSSSPIRRHRLLNYSSSLTKRSKMRVRMKRRMALSVQKISRRLLRSSVLNLRLKLRATLDSRSSILLKFYELRLGGCGRKLIRRNTTRRPRSLTLRASRNGETLTKIAMASSCYLLKTSSPRLRHLDLILRR